MAKTPYYKDDYTQKPLRDFDFKLYLVELGFQAHALDNLKYFKGDCLSVTIIPGTPRTAVLKSNNKSEKFEIPMGYEDAQMLFKKLNLIK